MELQIIIAVNVVALSAITVVHTLFLGGGGARLPWAIVNGIVAAVSLLAVLLVPEWSGWIAAAAFIPLVALPALFGHLAMRAAMAGKSAKAAQLARLAAMLHPTPDTRRTAAMLDALAVDRGTGDGAALSELARQQSPELRAPIEAHAAVERGDWQEVLRIARGDTRGGLHTYEIRALGETGRLDEMVEASVRAQKILQPTHERLLTGLFVLAFAGRAEAVDRLLAGRLGSLTDDAKYYWSAIAEMAAGDPRGQATLEQLARSADIPRTRTAAARHLARPLAELARHMSSASKTAVAALELKIAAPVADRSSGVPTHRGAAASTWLAGLAAYPVTVALIAANVIGYGVQIWSGNPESMRTLMRLGALSPENVIVHGEWWRLVTSTLLHGFPLHLAVNMIALGSLGTAYESMVGSLRMLAVYVIGGLGAGAAVLWLMWYSYIDWGFLVGASGAIFALFGALTTYAVLAYHRTRDRMQMARLINIAVIIAIQVIIDFSMPANSFSAHAAGFVIGLLLGLPLARAALKQAATGDA